MRALTLLHSFSSHWTPHRVSPFSQASVVYYQTEHYSTIPEIGTGISEANKKVPIFLHDVRGGKQVPVPTLHRQELRQTQGN